MILPKGFQFSQGSLQDYEDCHYRFFLRYVQQLAWPAVESEPMLESERYAQQGKQFHKMIQQHLVGVPAESITAMIASDELNEWWQNYLDYYRQEGMEDQSALYPEISLSAPLGHYRLTATFDLITLHNNGSLIITDWKTNRRRPQRIWLERRLQTRVYPYVLTRAGDFLNRGDAVEPKQIRMVYWFAGFPNQPEHFIYDTQAYTADQSYLENLADEIHLAPESSFTKTSDERRCQFCVYRSLCARGVQAGNLDLVDESQGALSESESELPFDIDQIAEMAY